MLYIRLERCELDRNYKERCIGGDLCALKFPCIVLIDLTVPLYCPSHRLGWYRVWIRGDCKEGIISFPELETK